MSSSVPGFLYNLFLTLHNLARWLVLVFAGIALYQAYSGWIKRKEWTRAADRAGIIFTSVIDTQLLLGLVLYFLFSPTTASLFANFSTAIKNPVTAFFGVEHVFAMAVAAVVAHVTRAVTRKMKDPILRHRNSAFGFTLSLLIILLAIPWPFLGSIARPWFRLFGLTF